MVPEKIKSPHRRTSDFAAMHPAPPADETTALLREIRDLLLRQEENAAKSLEISRLAIERQAEALETQKNFSHSYRKITPFLIGLIFFIVGIICFILFGLVRR